MEEFLVARASNAAEPVHDNDSAQAFLLLEIRIAEEVDASFRRAVQCHGDDRTAELSVLLARLLAPVPPRILELCQGAQNMTASRTIYCFELIGGFLATSLAAVMAPASNRASSSEVATFIQTIEAVELLHQEALPELWSHATFPEVYALAYHAYVSVAPPASELEERIRSLLKRASAHPEVADHKHDADDSSHLPRDGHYKSTEQHLYVGASLRRATVFTALDDGAAANRFASLTSGANRLFWRDVEEGTRTFAALYSALYHAAVARRSQPHVSHASPREGTTQCSDTHNGRGLSSALHPRMLPRSESAELFETYLSSAAAAWPLPVESTTLGLLPDWIQQDIVLLLFRWFPWYGAKVNTTELLLHVGGGKGAFESSLNAYVEELSLHVRGLRSEAVLLVYVQSIRYGLSGVPLSHRTANVLHTTLHKLATPGAPVYPSRRLRHAAQATIDELFPHGRIPRRLVQLCFRLVHPHRWPTSLGHWVYISCWTVVGWSIRLLGLCCRRVTPSFAYHTGSEDRGVFAILYDMCAQLLFYLLAQAVALVAVAYRWSLRCCCRWGCRRL